MNIFFVEAHITYVVALPGARGVQGDLLIPVGIVIPDR